MNREELTIPPCPDPVDAGSQLGEAERVAALDAQLRRARRDWRPIAEGETERECAGVHAPDDCGELVEPGRRAHGFIRCIRCQTIVEAQRKQGIRP